MLNRVKLQALKDVLTTNLAFDKSRLDFRVLCYNSKFRRMMDVWRKKTIRERVRDFEEIFEFLNSYNGVSIVEKKLKGEVYTPIPLIEEMLNTLPKEFWEQSRKILEPANGTGNFVAVLVRRFMYGFKHPDGWETKGLSELYENEEERYKYIMEEMIHVCDIQPKNMFFYELIFNPDGTLKLKKHVGSFLEQEFNDKMKEWRVEGFDLVCGNPPYNSKNSNNNDKIYFKFIRFSLDYLKNVKYLLYVLPEDSINYINSNFNVNIELINSSNITERYFSGIGNNILYFLVQKINYNKTILINNQNVEEIDLKKFSIVMSNVEDTKLINKIQDNKNIFKYQNAKYNNNNFRIRFNNIKKVKFNLRGIDFVCIDNKLLNSNNLIKEQNIDTNFFKYKVVDHSTDRIEFLSNKIFDNYKNRVIINTIGEIMPIIDYDGDYFLTDSMIYIKNNNSTEAQNLLMYLKSKISKYFQKTITNNTKNKFKILDYLPKVDLSKSWTDEELYKYFDLTPEEIKLIEDTVK